MQIEIRNPYIPQTATKVDVKDFVTTNSYIPNYVLKVSEALKAKGVQITLKWL